MENTPYIVGPSKSGVYAWINLVNGKVYVGSSRNIPKRRAEHLRFLRNGNHHSPHLQAAWDSYGRDAFAFEVLEPVEDPIWLEAREATWMLRLQAFHKELQGYSGHNFKTIRIGAVGRRAPKKICGNRASLLFPCGLLVLYFCRPEGLQRKGHPGGSRT